MNVQWGTFHRPGSVQDMLREAEQAMRQQGYQLFNTVANNNSMVIGGNASVLVQATSISVGNNQTFDIVTAYSEDASIAEQARNAIRDGMPGVVIIDNGSVGVPAEG